MPLEFPEFCCPQCKGDLDHLAEAYACPPCDRRYPVVRGIPDFRVFPDPYIDYEDDHNKGGYLVEHARDLNFEGMVRLYWKITPHVEEERANRFVRNALALEAKGAAHLAEIELLHGPLGARSVLEVGCGTGGFLIAAKKRFNRVVGIDIAFRWLVTARKRLDEAGLEVPLVCCCAEYLPFKDSCFDLIVVESALEHIQNQKAALSECHRVSVDQGVMFIAAVNRFALAPDPHVRVWGVGFLPRRWMKPYVRLIKGIPYDFIRVLSMPELRRMLRGASFFNHRATIPGVAREEARNFSATERAQLAIYDMIRKTPLIFYFLYLFGPVFHILSYADKQRRKR